MRTLLRNHIRDIIVNVVIGSACIPAILRGRLLKAYGIDAKRAMVSARCFFGSSRVSIGDRTFVNYGCFFDALDQITIGRDCTIAMEVLFTTSTHEVGPSNRRGGASVKAPIVVGDGVWIGARAMILPGVTIGSGCVIGAGAVVTRDCARNGLYVGVPARRVQDLPDSGFASPLTSASSAATASRNVDVA